MRLSKSQAPEQVLTDISAKRGVRRSGAEMSPNQIAQKDLACLAQILAEKISRAHDGLATGANRSGNGVQ